MRVIAVLFFAVGMIIFGFEGAMSLTGEVKSATSELFLSKTMCWFLASIAACMISREFKESKKS